MAKYKAVDIAKWFLYKSLREKEQGDGDNITLLKLLKLLYYAEGCSLAVVFLTRISSLGSTDRSLLRCISSIAEIHTICRLMKTRTRSPLRKLHRPTKTY